MPDFRTYAITVSAPGATSAEATRTQGLLIRDVMRKNPTSFRVFSPDETASNRWQACFEVTKRCSVAEVSAEDEDVAADGRVMEMLSEHQMQGNEYLEIEIRKRKKKVRKREKRVSE